MTTHPHSHEHAHADTGPHEHSTIALSAVSTEVLQLQRIEKIIMFLEAHFGSVELVDPSTQNLNTVQVKVEPEDANMEDATDAKDENEVKDKNEDEEPNGPAIVVTLDEHQAHIGLLDMVGHFPYQLTISSQLTEYSTRW